MTAPGEQAVELDPLSLVFGATGPVAVIVWILLLASVLSWTVIIVKARQLTRWLAAEATLARELAAIREPERMLECSKRNAEALGARVVERLVAHANEPELADAVAEAAHNEQRERLFAFMPILSSIASSAPFVGLLGTVWGILDAFLRIGQEKSASLPVVAPAIGEALIVTALGLFTAIPAAIAYNFLSSRLEDLAARVQASSRLWIRVLVGAAGRVQEG